VFLVIRKDEWYVEEKKPASPGPQKYEVSEQSFPVADSGPANPAHVASMMLFCVLEPWRCSEETGIAGSQTHIRSLPEFSVVAQELGTARHSHASLPEVFRFFSSRKGKDVEEDKTL